MIWPVWKEPRYRAWKHPHANPPVPAAQGLAGPQDGLGDTFALHESAVGGIEIGNDDFVAPQQDFAMPPGNGRVGDLKGVSFRAPDRDPVRTHFVRQTRQASGQNNKFGHIEIRTCRL